MLAELALAFLAASCLAPRAHQLALEGGTGNGVDVAGIGWEVPLTDACNDWRRLHGGLLFRLDGWHGRHTGGRNLVDASVTPFLRYELGRPLATPIYAEAGIGAHLLSKTRIDDWRQFSTAFQFGEFAGLATRYGDKGQYMLGARVQHVSNGGIKRPNDGLTYGMVFFNYSF